MSVTRGETLAETLAEPNPIATGHRTLAKIMTTKTKNKISKAEREAYALVGKKGGKAIAKKLGKKGMSDLGKRGAEKRWPKK